MSISKDLAEYAEKMRRHVAAGTDLSADARFVDMLAPRNARILDIGCGIGTAVSCLRAHDHLAFGVDPSPEVLAAAGELYDEEWYRALAVSDLSTSTLASNGLPTSFDLILLSGNVPAFLPEGGLAGVFTAANDFLAPGGALVIGTTAHAVGGPTDQDAAASATALELTHRFADWHLGAYLDGSPWSVSVFAAPGTRPTPHGPDGIFILPPMRR